MKYPLSQDDQHCIEKVLRDDKDRILYYGLVDTGIRISEWCALDYKKAIDAINVGMFNVGTIEDGFREVPASKRFAKVLAKYMSKIPTNKAVCFKMPLCSRTAEYRLRELRTLAKVKSQVTPATLRLTFVANAILKGIPEQAIRKALGWWSAADRELYEKLAESNPVTAFKKNGW